MNGKVTGETTVSVTGGTGTNVYGGGSSATATVTGTTTVTVTGGTVSNLYGKGQNNTGAPTKTLKISGAPVIGSASTVGADLASFTARQITGNLTGAVGSIYVTPQATASGTIL